MNTAMCVGDMNSLTLRHSSRHKFHVMAIIALV